MGVGFRAALVVALAMIGAAHAAESVPEKVDPKSIWPAPLKEYEGRYVYVQVASPGGLWERYTPAAPDALTVARQVSINEVPAALREKLTRGEIVIAEVQDSEVEASQVVSPSRRGNLRYYAETARGLLTVRNLPGLAGRDEAPDSYSGRVIFSLEHQSHSNPSPAGVLFQRDREEMTWGGATLDYADLMAFPLPPEGKEDEETLPVLANARVLRSAREIFAFVEWSQPGADGVRVYSGCVRLRRAEDLADAMPAPPPAGPNQPPRRRGEPVAPPPPPDFNG
ncbi:MAG: hypothetical protein QHJ73_17195 [Armatimonadota bacterium]|nr:hypothetical protein [Armatimonadota bacterium]